MAASSPAIPRAAGRRDWRSTSFGLMVLCTFILALAPSAQAARAARHGGTIMATWGASLSTVDPAYTYSYVDWPQTHALFDGLLGFSTGTNLVPHMATAMPDLSKDGLTYTFHLRHGLQFSNGDPITAQDFIYSWERMLAPKTASPDTYLMPGLAGEAPYLAGKAQHISGLSAPDQYTVKVTLSAPMPFFPYLVAIPSGMVVDPAAVHQAHADNKDMSTNVVSSGPFMLKDWVRGQKMDLVRNPHYWDPNLPQADAVHIDLGVDASVALLRIQKGQSDLMGDSIPSAQFASVVTDPKWHNVLYRLPDVGVYMIALNVKVKPFDNLLVRKAVAYAINKMHAVRFINGRGTPATSIIPPTMPGFAGGEPELYPYNPDKAKQLLAQAGYPSGFSTTIGVPDSVFETRVADAAIADLANVGIKLTVKKVVTEGTAVANLPMQSYHWLLDYPDPSDFINGFTSCAGAVVGGSNVGFYCNKALDALAAKAQTMPLSPARVAAYKAIDEKYMADVPSVPVFNDVYYEVHSARLQNFNIPLMWYPFDLTTYWPAS